MHTVKFTVTQGGQGLDPAQQTFWIREMKTAGWTIGRGKDCDWTLPDPNRFLSNRHLLLQYDTQHQHYVVFDMSTNGVFINGSNVPLGRGHQYVLGSGDVLQCGPYTLTVAYQDAIAEPVPAASERVRATSRRKSKAAQPVEAGEQPLSEDASALWKAFLEGLAVPEGEAPIPSQDAIRLMRHMGAYLRQSLVGMRELLSAATSLSQEFSGDVGTLNGETCAVFLGRMPASQLDWDWAEVLHDPAQYANLPGETLAAYLQYLKDHELALCVAFDAAMDALMQQFDPQHLQMVFDQMVKPGLRKQANKARYWEAYHTYFARFKKENEGYHALFQEQFAEAYHKQMTRLAAIHDNWQRLVKNKAQLHAIHTMAE